ncbi:MAG: Maf family protein [Thermodesulfobacteriota bacterium]|nr:Maf family protein [Thermodesulfobacteriota bacterium]
MFKTCKPLILASSSPRRQQFLTDLGLTFSCLPADIDETPKTGETPIAFALRLALAKAEIIAEQHPQAYVIGSDTVVTLSDRILGKPADAAHALDILSSLQGKTHQVITGLSLTCLQDNCFENLTRTTNVTFSAFSDSILRAYIRTEEPMDKAGAYGIQGKGSFLVRTIQGSCSNVIGLPVNTCTSLLLQYGVIIPNP